MRLKLKKHVHTEADKKQYGYKNKSIHCILIVILALLFAIVLFAIWDHFIGKNFF